MAASRRYRGYRVTVRFDSATRTIKAEDRLIWNGVALNVRSSADPEGDKRFIVIFADAGVVTQ